MDTDKKAYSLRSIHQVGFAKNVFSRSVLIITGQQTKADSTDAYKDI